MTLTLAEWRSAFRPIADEIAGELFARVGCGPFDGGCLVFALALQQVIGGEVVVVTREGGLADHAAVHQADLLWDHAGPRARLPFLRRFAAAELRRSWRGLGIRPFREGDLSDASQDPELIERLAELLKTGLAGYLPYEAHSLQA